jgi:hypothetical protein
MPAVLRATLSIEPREAARAEEFRARCVLTNDGDEPAILNVAPLSSPSLALEIADEHDAPVHLPPPPVPSAEIPIATIAPGEECVAEFSAFFPAWTPPGRYRARFRYVPGDGGGRWLTGSLWSAWEEFRLG